MAKTAFVNGTIVTSAYLNTVYGSGAAGGHRHDGADADGSVDKINLSSGTDVKGYLPPLQIDCPFQGAIGGLEMAYSQVTDEWRIEFGYGYATSYNTGLVDGKFRRYWMWAQNNMKKKVVAASGTAYDNWVAGDLNGGVATGATAIADGVWLHAFIIGKTSDASAYDFGFDSSVVAANLLSGTWNIYRRVGSVRIESLGGGKFGITKFRQFGDRFDWESAQTEIDLSGGIPGSRTDYDAHFVPAGVKTVGRFIIAALDADEAHIVKFGTSASTTGGFNATMGPAGVQLLQHFTAVVDNSAANPIWLYQSLGTGALGGLTATGYDDFRGRQ